VLVAAPLLRDLEKPPDELAVDGRWVALQASVDSARSLTAVATLSKVIADAGIAFSVLTSHGGKVRLLVRRCDLKMCAAELVRARHAVVPAALACASPLRALHNGREIQAVDVAGVWALVSREIQGVRKAELREEPIRIQAKCGVFVDVLIPAHAGNLVAHASRGGHHAVVHDAGRRLSIRHRQVDFQPPTGEVHREVVKISGLTMDIASLPPNRYREVWRRLGSAEKIVALELAGDAKDRTGFWIFCNDRFARVITPADGEGLIAGTCCISLERLVQLRGQVAVEAELHSEYEATDGYLEASGRLRIRHDAWKPGLAGSLLYDVQDVSVGGTVTVMRSEGLLVHRLPGGAGEQTWRIREWTFDPFIGVEKQVAASTDALVHSPSAKQKDKARASSSSSSDSSSEGKNAKKHKVCKASRSRSRKNDRSMPRTDASKSTFAPVSLEQRGNFAFQFPQRKVKNVTAGAEFIAASDIMKRASEKRAVGVESEDAGSNAPWSPPAIFNKLSSGNAGPSMQPVQPQVKLGVPPPSLASGTQPGNAVPSPPPVTNFQPGQLLPSGPLVPPPPPPVSAYDPFNPPRTPMNALASASVAYDPFANPPQSIDPVALFAASNGLDRSAENALRQLPVHLQQQTIEMGPLMGTNASAMLMARIKVVRSRVG